MPSADPHSSDEAYDQWLVLRAQAGEQEALRRLVDRWSLRLRRHAMRLTGNPDGASDVCQEAWLAIVRDLRRLDDPACFRRWAYRIVGNKCVDWVRRRQKRRAQTTQLAEEPVAPRGADEPPEQRDEVRAALARMTAKDRAILALHYTEDMPLREIADAMSLPLGTVKSRLYHARQRLKEALSREANQAIQGDDR